MRILSKQKIGFKQRILIHLEIDLKKQKDVVIPMPQHVAMSNRIKDLKVNGKSVSSRCPVSVPASGKTTIEVTGPDGSTKATYTLTFVVG